MTYEYCLFFRSLLLFFKFWVGFGMFCFVLSSLSRENGLKFWRRLVFDACSLWVIFPIDCITLWMIFIVSSSVILILSLRVVSLVLTQSSKVSSLLICYQPLFLLSLISHVIIDSCLFYVVLSCCNSCFLALSYLLLWKSGWSHCWLLVVRC